MENKICLITGATSGIGYITARELAAKGAKVVIHGRSKDKVDSAREAISELTGAGNTPDILLGDFSSLDDVRKAAADFNKKYDRLDVLINNAGLILGRERQTSVDGYELTIAINHLAPFLFTGLVFDKLRSSSQARIINVSSEAHRAASPDFEDFHMEQSYSSFKAYGNSKLYNIMFTEELAERMKPYSNIATYSLHPGTVATNFSESAGGLINFGFKLIRPFISSSEQGAQTSIYLASEEHIPAYSGAYFVSKKPAEVKHKFFTPANNRRLWELSEEFTGTSFLTPEQVKFQ